MTYDKAAPAPLFRFAVSLQALASGLEQPAHVASAHRKCLPCEFPLQLRGALAGPPQGRLRIPALRRINQPLQGRRQLGGRSGHSFPASSGPTISRRKSGDSFRYSFVKFLLFALDGYAVSAW